MLNKYINKIKVMSCITSTSSSYYNYAERVNIPCVLQSSCHPRLIDTPPPTPANDTGEIVFLTKIFGFVLQSHLGANLTIKDLVA